MQDLLITCIRKEKGADKIGSLCLKQTTKEGASLTIAKSKREWKGKRGSTQERQLETSRIEQKGVPCNIIGFREIDLEHASGRSSLSIIPTVLGHEILSLLYLCHRRREGIRIGIRHEQGRTPGGKEPGGYELR